jgi:alpha 1,2-mannosyltransferase
MKDKNCIIFLTKSDLNSLKELKNSLVDIYRNYVDEFPCDVIVFHEEGFSEEFIKQASKKFKNLKFIKIELKQPDFLTQQNLSFKDGLTFLGIGYRNMCRFNLCEFYKHLKDYEYYWRLDVDSHILSKINYDLFKYLKDNNKVYGYVAELPEHPPAIQLISPFIKNYVEKYNLKGKFLDYFLDKFGNYNYRMIYNNFEICKVNFHFTEENTRFINEVDKTGYIYEYRWGDAPIRTLSLALHVDRNKLHRFKDIDYQHQGFKIVNGVIECEYIPKEWIEKDDFIT